MWMTIKDLADHLEVSVKTIRRRLAKGEWETKEVKEGTGSPTLYIFFETGKVGTPKVDTSKVDKLDKVDTYKVDKMDKVDTYKVDKLDKVDTSKVDKLDKVDTSKVDIPVGQIDKPLSQNFNLTGQEKKPESHPQAGAVSSTAPALLKQRSEVPASEELTLYKRSEVQPSSEFQPVPKIVEGYFVEKQKYDLRPVSTIPEKYMKLAELRTTLCEDMIMILRKATLKSEAWEAITNLYNTGNLIKPLFKIEGSKSMRTLKRLLKQYKDSGQLTEALAPAYGTTSLSRSVPIQTMNDLLEILLHPNQVSIGSAILSLKVKYRMKDMQLPVSARTLRRAAEDYKQNNIGKWVLTREGMKAFRDKIGMVITRDTRLLNVGDVWIADGHKMAFDIINPDTGKAQRFNLVVFFDWASRFPVGADVSLTENTDSIKLAYRNGGLFCGYLPSYLYLDNGRAFKSRALCGNPEQYDLEELLSGTFYRAGSCPFFALPYNARAKSEERFFLTMQNQFERLISSFRGAGIDDKPAGLMRNEKWIQKMYEREPLTMEEFKLAFNWYVFEFYGKNPHKGLNGRTPLEVYIEGSKHIPSKRLINPNDLNFLMLSRDKKKISNKGIELHKLFYWDEKLVSHVGEESFVLYDNWNLDSILVFTENQKEFICQASQEIKMHPFYRLADNPIKTKAELDTRIKQQRRIEKQAKQGAEQQLKQISESTESFTLQFHEEGSLFYDKPSLEMPKKQLEKSLEELTAEQLDKDNEITLNVRKKKETEDIDDLPKAENLGFNL